MMGLVVEEIYDGQLRNRISSTNVRSWREANHKLKQK